ncbi:MAG: glycosyltransferase family 2 protein [Clostridia bacterium]|nr:glycosyltransferase family 2 protein [Clostridia bacterium]
MGAKRKLVSIMVPCYNEEENVVPIAQAIVAQMETLPQYDYELLFIDNCSTDGTRALIRGLCRENTRIRAIFNVKNFGQFNSPYYGLCQTSGDCTISICADFQDPVEMIPEFLSYWEEGYQIVCGVKTHSMENKLMYKLRGVYYKLIRKFSDVDQIEQFTGFGLYDKSFIQVLRDLDDPTPFIRGIVAELGGKRKEVPYTQPNRRAGKTHNNWYTLYDAAMLSITSYTKAGMRIAVFAGAILSVICIIIGIVYLIMKLLYWDRFDAGQAPLIIVTSLMCSILLAFMGFLGEYIAAINQRMMHRPLVVEEERLNFPAKEDVQAEASEPPETK